MKKQLLSMMLLAGALLAGCQSNSVEPAEPTEEVVVNEQEQQTMTEEERQAHIDEIRKSINGEQEEITTEEYFEQQRKEKSQEAIANAHNWREYNDIIVHGFGDLTEQKEETKKPQKEESYLDIVSEILGRDVKEGLTYDNFLLVGTVDFNSVKTINELFGFKGDLVSEYGSHTVYQWEDRNGFKLVTVGFDNGIAVSKSQVGL